MDGRHEASRGLRRALVDTLRSDGHLHSARIAQAFADVPRELFVPGVPLEEVYRPSEAIVTKRLDGVNVSSASAPEVVAIMLEQLELRPGDRVLEIGAGTGYNAALMAHVVGPRGHVVTLDIDEDLVLGARAHLHEAGYANVEAVQTDGALGHQSAAHFDRIILTVASSDIAPAWREQLARPHGRLVLPLSLRGPQRTVAFTPNGGHLTSTSVRNCSFISLRGLLASGSGPIQLGPDRSTVLTMVDEPLPLDVDTIAEQLRTAKATIRTGVWTSQAEIRAGFNLWLMAHQSGTCAIWGGARVPDLFGLADRAGARGTLCVMDEQGLVLLGRADESPAPSELLILTAPSSAEALAERVQSLIRRWDATGRPVDTSLQIRAYPHGEAPPLVAGEVAIDQRWSRFVLSWRPQAPAIFT